MEQGIVPNLTTEVLTEVTVEVASKTKLNLDCNSSNP